MRPQRATSGLRGTQVSTAEPAALPSSQMPPSSTGLGELWAGQTPGMLCAALLKALHRPAACDKEAWTPRLECAPWKAS